ncbi:MAG: efflux RND transporter periplasmic adaptor subunit [Bacteroidota bacterium]
MQRILRIGLTLLLLAAIAGAIWWQLAQNKATKEEQLALATTQIAAIPVTTIRAEAKTINQAFTVNGTFEPAQELVVVSTVNGQIVQCTIRPGSYVKKGDLMIVVDNTYTQNELDATRLQLDKAEKDVTRMEKLIGEGGVTQAQYEEANVKLEGAKIQIQSLEKRLQDAYIKAPISGTIVLLPRTQEPMVGGFLGQGKPICQIVNVNQMRFKVQLTEEQIVQVESGLSVEARAEVFPEASYPGKVSFIGIKSEILSKRYPVEVTVSNRRDFPLKAGMSGKASFQIGEVVLPLALPRKAFVGSVDAGKLFVVEDGKAKEQLVQTGKTIDGQVEVLSGLNSGAIVVLSGQINLEDGSTINVVQ